jgi:sugar phosphate isomerase/epimerase
MLCSHECCDRGTSLRQNAMLKSGIQNLMIALSTSWNSTEAGNGKEMLSQILDMGFEAIELDYRLTGTMLDEMRPLLGRDVQVVSIHNFCPVPNILPKEMAGSDAFLLSSSDREERERAIKYTIKTIELADTIDARIVICHFGHVDVSDPTEELIGLYNKGERESDDFELLLQKAKAEREASRQRNLDAVLFSLDKLSQRGEKLGVFIGIENRRGFRQIPSLDEIGVVLSEFDGANVLYWHNTGYAQVQDNLGIASHEDFLEQYSGKMIGVHLHDVKFTTDHLVPGQGDLDFRMVGEYMSRDAVKVMQLAPKATREEITEGLSHLKESGIW